MVLYAAGTVVNGLNGTVVYPLATVAHLASMTYITLGVIAALVLFAPWSLFRRLYTHEIYTTNDTTETVAETRPPRKPRWKRTSYIDALVVN